MSSFPPGPPNPPYPPGPPVPPSYPPPAGPPPAGPRPTTCYRHPDRSAGVSCQRCNRPICPSCMVQASVGFHCPECVKGAARSAPAYSLRTLPKQQPYVTYALILINVAVFVGDLATAKQVRGGSIGEAYLNGVLFGPAVGQGEWWRLVTGGFLHASITHIAFNMFALYVLGRQLEGLLGPWRFLAVYFAALFAGSLGVIIVSPQSPTVGASGAIYGLFGVAVAFQFLKKVNMMQSGLGPMLLINLAITFTIPGISIGGHLGGLAGGAAVGYVMLVLEERRQSPAIGIAVAFGVMAVCAAAAIALAPTSF